MDGSWEYSEWKRAAWPAAQRCETALYYKVATYGICSLCKASFSNNLSNHVISKKHFSAVQWCHYQGLDSTQCWDCLDGRKFFLDHLTLEFCQGPPPLPRACLPPLRLLRPGVPWDPAGLLQRHDRMPLQSCSAAETPSTACSSTAPSFAPEDVRRQPELPCCEQLWHCCLGDFRDRFAPAAVPWHFPGPGHVAQSLRLSGSEGWDEALRGKLRIPEPHDFAMLDETTMSLLASLPAFIMVEVKTVTEPLKSGPTIGSALQHCCVGCKGANDGLSSGTCSEEDSLLTGTSSPSSDECMFKGLWQ